MNFLKHLLGKKNCETSTTWNGDMCGFWLVSVDPLVFLVRDYIFFQRSAKLHLMLNDLRQRPIVLFIQLSWNYESEGKAQKHKDNLLHFQKLYPSMVFVFLTNTEGERYAFQKLGVGAEWVHHNTFVDDRIFCPISNMEKRFKAVYDGRMSLFKRHELAAEVASLALITYRIPCAENHAYDLRTQQELAHAHWFNERVEGEYRSLSLPEINAALNQCNVGLCLSAEEGGMLASIQYLLAGLPVVTTASLGGRDVFFDPEYVLTVAASPQAVAQGVDTMIARNLSADKIRLKTIEKMRDHQKRFIQLLKEVGKMRFEDEDWQSQWLEIQQFNTDLWTVDRLRQAIDR